MTSGDDSFCQFHLGAEEEEEAVEAIDASAMQAPKSRPRPTSIFSEQQQQQQQPGTSLPDPPRHLLLSFDPGRTNGSSGRSGGKNKGSRAGVPQIRCSSHFCGASAPATPSNGGGQHLPGWMQGVDPGFRSPSQEVRQVRKGCSTKLMHLRCLGHLF